MSQGDLWTYKRTGEHGIEFASNDDYLQLALIREDWPFPSPPVWVLRKECERSRQRYLHNQYPIDMEESPI